VIGVLFVVAPAAAWFGTTTYPPRKPLHGERNVILAIAGAEEAGFAKRGNSYTSGSSSASCPGVGVCWGEAAIPELDIAAHSDRWHFQVESLDRDHDGRCEAYAITAIGVKGSVRGKVVGYDSTGAKSGAW